MRTIHILSSPTSIGGIYIGILWNKKLIAENRFPLNLDLHNTPKDKRGRETLNIHSINLQIKTR